MPVGRNCCYKESVSADIVKYLPVRFLCIPARKENTRLILNRVPRVDYEILSFTGTRFLI